MDSEHGFRTGKKNVLPTVSSQLLQSEVLKRNGYDNYPQVLPGHYTVHVRSSAAP